MQPHVRVYIDLFCFLARARARARTPWINEDRMSSVGARRRARVKWNERKKWRQIISFLSHHFWVLYFLYLVAFSISFRIRRVAHHHISGIAVAADAPTCHNTTPQLSLSHLLNLEEKKRNINILVSRCLPAPAPHTHCQRIAFFLEFVIFFGSRDARKMHTHTHVATAMRYNLIKARTEHIKQTATSQPATAAATWQGSVEKFPFLQGELEQKMK